MPSFTIHEGDNGKTIEVPLDARIRLELKENPTTGYKWTEPAFDERFLALEADGFSMPGPAEIGGGGSHYFAFVAKGKGKSAIRVLNKRPWEKGEWAAAVFEVSVLVKQ